MIISHNEVTILKTLDLHLSDFEWNYLCRNNNNSNKSVD